MKIPFKIRLFNPFKKTPRYIVLHDVSCMSSDLAEVRLDKKRAQTGKLRSYQYIKQMEPDLNYHYVVEMIEEDYEVLTGRPFAVFCDYPDILSPMDYSFHICLMGNYNYDIPDRRVYQKICYNLLSPMMRLYKIPISRILTHSEVSQEKDLKCPGNFFDKDLLLNYLKGMLLAK